MFKVGDKVICEATCASVALVIGATYTVASVRRHTLQVKELLERYPSHVYNHTDFKIYTPKHGDMIEVRDNHLWYPREFACMYKGEPVVVSPHDSDVDTLLIYREWREIQHRISIDGGAERSITAAEYGYLTKTSDSI